MTPGIQQARLAVSINPLASLAGLVEGREGIADVSVRRLWAWCFGKA